MGRSSQPSTKTRNHLKAKLLRYAQRFCPIHVRQLSDPSPIHPRFPSGEGTPKKPVETVSNGVRTAQHVVRG
ncbi:MAG: hypothetical protein EZS28_039643 [Streblomastix strix]|uniref:Uncharacterized protein n=1 Tax=Streblomastix strix TaxID=222440 RepID=A0A5J4U4D4_9EUKA|nr:MAG: hypothetical protein EZS28_039643 [Streblomastix strix]